MALPMQQTAAAPGRLELVSSHRGHAGKRHSAIAWWHLLSLDAPTVAALWVVFVAWCAGVRLSVLDPVAMFVAVWMLYAADRLLDARPLSAGWPGVNPGNTRTHSTAFADLDSAELEDRHRFHHLHRHRFVPCLAAGAIPLAFLLHRLAAPVLHLYVMLVSLLAGWLLLVHAQPVPSAGTRRLPKELAVGLFFPAAIFIPTVARAPALRLPLLPSALLFACICTLNCLFLYAWEHPVNCSRAHATTRWALRRLVVLDLTLCLAGSVIALIAARISAMHGFAADISGLLPHPAAMPAACALSMAILLLLHLQRHRFAALPLRALADVALLTPLLFFAWSAAAAAK